MKKYIKYLLFFIFISFLLRIFLVDSDSFIFMDWIKSLLYPFVKVYLLAFQNPNTAILLFLTIIISCIFTLYWIYFEKYIPLKKKLDASIAMAELLQSIDNSTEVGLRESIDILENDEILKSFSLKFKNFIKHDNNHISEYDYLSIGMIETKGFPLKIISALPGYFVGFGLVFTFLGLVAALYFSAQGMKAGSYEDAKTSLMQLLYASSFKFTTSIAGISSSLLISILYKSLLHQLDLKFSRLNDLLGNVHNLYINYSRI